MASSASGSSCSTSTLSRSSRRSSGSSPTTGRSTRRSTPSRPGRRLMFEQLEAVRQRYDAISERLADPAVHQDLKELQRLGKEQAQLRDLVQTYQAYRRAERGMADARDLAEHEKDPEMQAYARQEFDKQQAERD